MLGPYRLDQLLGSGGMGAVWRAWDERLERWVALKHVRVEAAVAHGRERLRREARAAARLNHPSIVHVYDIVEGADGDWIVMELVPGKTLRCLINEEKALPPARVLALGREITEGLAEAHAQGILHRDLKATNVIVSTSGRAKILDFGLAKQMPREGGPEHRDLTISIPGHILGTTYAMSPEQAMGRALDARSDLFSLGSLLYEMLTGKAPFRAESAVQSLAWVVELKLPPLQRSYPELPPALCELVDWLLQKEPHKRPSSAAEVLAALDAAAGPGQTLQKPEEPTIVTLVDRPVRQQSGERRTVTIVCCGLVQLDRAASEAGALDLEVLSEAALAFEGLGREVCRELSGSLGTILGRTLWLCFGYPQAHEDDAERAVRAARELQARFAALPLSAAHRLGVRAGLHTGPAVVVTRSSEAPALQPGDTFDIAMAIQSQVPAGRIGVSAASRKLLQRKFATQPLPAVHLKDLDATVAVYEIGSSLEPGSREDVLLPPLVNREAELQILLDRYRLACSGSGQAVLIAGDAGIGKSRLVRALSEKLAAEAPTVLTAHGSTFTQNTPLAPILHLLGRVLFSAESRAEASAEEKLRRLEEVLGDYGLPLPEDAPLLGALLGLPAEERYPPLVLSPEARRKRTLAVVLALLGAMAERRPIVLVIEDLHWIDPSTLELLDLLLGELPMLPLLLVATFRPDFTAPWRHQASITQLRLGGLSESHARQLVALVAAQVAEGKRLPADVHREIVVRTDGNPLFVEELTKAVLEAAAPLREPAGLPITLGASLLARLDRLGEAKGVAQLAAVLGRTFSLEQLEALSWIKGAALSSALSRLVQAEILYRRGPAQTARYIFKHALIQDAAYLSLLASDRQQLHRRLAGLLQEQFPAVAEAEPELMAHHCERGGLAVEAVDYLLEAGLRAAQRSAHLEAMSLLNRGLALLRGLPSSPELAGRELSLRAVLTASLEALKGWGAPEVAGNAERCAALCRELGETGGLIQALSSLWAHHLLRADRRPTLDLADEIARLAETPAQVYMGLATRGYTAYYGGHFAAALALAEQAIALYEPELIPELAVFGDDSILMPHLMKSWALWTLGEPEKAIRQQDAAFAVAETLGSPFALGMALFSEMGLWHDLRDPERLADVAERLLKLAGEQEFAFLYASAHCGKGLAACQRGDLASGTELIQTGIELYIATGARLGMGYWSSYLIEAYLTSGRLAEGLAAAREALAWSETRLDVSTDAEILRLQAELLHASGDAGAAEAAFQKSLAVARGQEARSLELRTATRLAAFLAEQGRAGEALPVLTAAYQTFREGFETRDLQEARELLDRMPAVS
jgi:class 3 adenylate cyclase/tetratricopeptide (TPR) repeat protein/ABC-type transport system involved in cytochrome c biogenesis ATPase subunit